MNRASFSLAQGITSGSCSGGTRAEKSTPSSAAPRAAMCSGVVPQQPPKIRAPAAANFPALRPAAPRYLLSFTRASASFSTKASAIFPSDAATSQKRIEASASSICAACSRTRLSSKSILSSAT